MVLTFTSGSAGLPSQRPPRFVERVASSLEGIRHHPGAGGASAPLRDWEGERGSRVEARGRGPSSWDGERGTRPGPMLPLAGRLLLQRASDQAAGVQYSRPRTSVQKLAPGRGLGVLTGCPYWHKRGVC